MIWICVVHVDRTKYMAQVVQYCTASFCCLIYQVLGLMYSFRACLQTGYPHQKNQKICILLQFGQKNVYPLIHHFQASTRIHMIHC